MPAALNHSAISWFSAAAPEMKKRTRPPNRSPHLAEDQRVGDEVLGLQRGARACVPRASTRLRASPTLKA